MKTLITALVGLRKNPRVAAAALLTAGAVGGWAISATLSAKATALDDTSRFGIGREANAHKLALEAPKPALIGSYVVTGTDSDGKPYAGPGIVGIALAPSGALELEWDNGKQVGVGEVIGNVLAVACLTKGRTEQSSASQPPDHHSCSQQDRLASKAAHACIIEQRMSLGSV
jgi:hypothetical protein